MGALALAKSKLHAGGVLARAGIRGRRHRRRHFGARRLRSVTAPRASSPTCSAMPTSSRPAGSEARAPDFLTTHPATPERIKNALANARQFSGPGAGERDRDQYLGAISTAWPMARTRAKASCAAGASCIPSSALPSWRRRDFPRQYRAGGARPQRRRRGAAARRGQRAGRAVAARISEVGLDGEGRSGKRRAIHRQRLPGGDRDRSRRPMVVPPVRRALRQRRLSLHFRGEEHARRKSTARSASRSQASAA